LAADLPTPGLTIDLGLLPGGERCRLQVVAAAGLRTTLAETAAFAVARKPLRAHILSPAAGTRVPSGAPVLLDALGYSPDVGTVDLETALWTSSRDGRLGIGRRLLVNQLTPGEHRIRLRAAMDGQELADDVVITVEPSE
jgi:hypothetical protein